MRLKKKKKTFARTAVKCGQYSVQTRLSPFVDLFEIIKMIMLLVCLTS